jgi:short-subunit dehydrogenase
LSESLFGELRAAAPGVHVSVLCPGLVATEIPDVSPHARAAAPARVGERGLLGIIEERTPGVEVRPMIGAQ